MSETNALRKSAWAGPERRNGNRGDALVALTRLLEATRRRMAVDALTISDSEGCLVAGSGAAQLCDELAASAPLLAAGIPANDTALANLALLARRSQVRRLLLDGIEVLISGHGDAVCESLEQVAAGCSRILKSRAC